MYNNGLPVLGGGVAVGALAATGLDVVAMTAAALFTVIAGLFLLRTRYLRRHHHVDTHH